MPVVQQVQHLLQMQALRAPRLPVVRVCPCPTASSHGSWEARSLMPDLYSSEYYLAHRVQIIQKNKRWDKRHPENARARRLRWQRSMNGKILTRNAIARRHKRDIVLHTILNTSFPNSCLHHTDEHTGVFVPTSLHTSLRHSLASGTGMWVVNHAVSLWLTYHDGWD